MLTSFLIDSLEAERSCRRHGRAPQLMMTWVWMSSPVTMFPTALRAALMTDCWLFMRSSTILLQTPLSITAWILSLGPSLR